MQAVIKKLLDNVFDRYFCPETNLIYEFTVDKTGNAWHHLPTVSDIGRQYPNPCGWGTGMEDSVLNAGTLLDALVSAYKLTKNENIARYCDKLLCGLLRCVKEDGFVARSISPFDHSSHYIESSRDQYTHWIYGAIRYFSSVLCTEKQKNQIKTAVCNIAEKCIRDVKEENNYSMLRYDGTVGIVNKMWDKIGTHEWLRLPMFYLASYVVSGDKKYYELYSVYRDEALENSIGHNPSIMRCYASLQMQCSLRFIYDYDRDEAVREKVLRLMEENALYGEKTAIANSMEFTKEEHKEELCYCYFPWDKAKTVNSGTFFGYTYINPGQNEHNPENPAFYPVREIAEGAIMASMCPTYRVSESLMNAVDNMAKCIDTENHYSVYAPLLLSCAHILCCEKKKVSDCMKDRL